MPSAPPGSSTAAQSLRLQSIDFGAALLPKFPSQCPAGPSLYAALVSHPVGIALLHASRHVPALIAVALGVSPPPVPPGGYGTPADAPAVTPLDRKAAWWALADVVSTPAGLGLVLASCPDWLTHVHALAHGLRVYKTVKVGSGGGSNGSSGGVLEAAAGIDPIDDASSRWLGVAVMARILRHRACAMPGPAAPQSQLPTPPPIAGHELAEQLGWQARGSTVASGISAVSASITNRAALVAVQGSDIAVGAGLALDSSPACVPLMDDTQVPGAFLAAAALPPAGPAWARVLTRIMELSSRITQRDARTALLTLRNDDPDLFASTGLYAHVHALLSRYTVPLPVRRFVHGLFERVSFSDRAWEGLGETV